MVMHVTESRKANDFFNAYEVATPVVTGGGGERKTRRLLPRPGICNNFLLLLFFIFKSSMAGRTTGIRLPQSLAEQIGAAEGCSPYHASQSTSISDTRCSY